MATAGSRDKNPFRPGGKLGTTKYYLLVDTDGTNKGRITIKTPTLQGNISGSDGDRTVGFIPLDNTFQPSTTTNPEEIEYFSTASAQKSVKNHGVITVQKSGVPQQQASQLIFPNTATPNPGSSGSPDPIPNAPVPINNPEIKTEGVRETYDDYYYPETLRGNKGKQDIIRFTAFSYTGRNLTIKDSSQTSFGTPGLAARNLKEIKGSVTLPIQPQITDNNSVQWGSENLNPLQAFGAAVSYGAQDDIAGAAQQTMDAVEKLAKTSGGNMSQAFRVYLAGKAVGVEGLLSRISGAVLNPNMELLFQGPQLRPFNFTFRLSPRNTKEAEQVKYIIRFFKENMSVQNTADNIFLKAPNVFQIRYLIRGEGDHPSLNRIKICALQSCSVDYTPDGSYMTFSDQDATMTSYSISLQFQELEPVTAKDYTSNTNIKEIGY